MGSGRTLRKYIDKNPLKNDDKDQVIHKTNKKLLMEKGNVYTKGDRNEKVLCVYCKAMKH